MTWQERTDTPAWALFRLELRRRWGARGLKRAALILVAVLVVQGVATWGISRVPYGTAGSVPWAQAVASQFGLYSGTLTALWQGVGPAGRGAYPFPIPVLVGLAISSAASMFLMPAYAALTFAPSRRDGRLGELLLTGMPPLPMFLAQGCAAVLPFAVLVMAAIVTRAVAFPPAAPQQMHLGPWAAAVISLGSSVSAAGILLSVSALCRGASTALAACYLTQFAGLPLLGALAWVPLMIARVSGPSLTWMVLLSLATRAAACAVLLRLALRALGSPEEAPPRRIRAGSRP